MAVSEDVRNTGDVSGDGPELSGGGSAEDGVAGDAAGPNEPDECFVAAAGLEGPCRIANEPRSHGVVGGLSAERLEQPGAGAAAIGCGLRLAAIGADDDLRLGHAKRLLR